MLAAKVLSWRVQDLVFGMKILQLFSIFLSVLPPYSPFNPFRDVEREGYP